MKIVQVIQLVRAAQILATIVLINTACLCYCLINIKNIARVLPFALANFVIHIKKGYWKLSHKFGKFYKALNFNLNS